MNCPICNSLNLIKKDKYREFTLYSCNDCKVIFWFPLKHPGRVFYETSELHEVSAEKKLQWRHKQFFKNPTIIKAGNFLDIGCGAGEFLNEVRKLGFEVWGIDIASRQVDFAKTKYGLKNVFVGTLEEFIKNNPFEFNVISFFEVLEHLDNPKEFIKNIKKILNTSGYIVFSVPNSDRKGIGKEAEEIPPNHLFRWTKGSIAKFLDQEGFEIVKIIEQPFSKEFFFTTGFFSFGIAKRIKESNLAIQQQEFAKRRNFISFLARIKNLILMPIASLLAFCMRLLGCKYWDLFVVAKLKNEK